jgi:hypothetical protein
MKQFATFDTSFWINAHRVGLLPHVIDLYTLRYAPSVGSELSPSFPSGLEFWRMVGGGVLLEIAPERDAIREFGPGERAAISLAMEHRDWTLLIDDQRPFQAAVQMGLRVICTPVLAIALFDQRRLSAEETLVALARLAAMQTVSPQLLALALAQLGIAIKQREDE